MSSGPAYELGRESVRLEADVSGLLQPVRQKPARRIRRRGFEEIAQDLNAELEYTRLEEAKLAAQVESLTLETVQLRAELGAARAPRGARKAEGSRRVHVFQIRVNDGEKTAIERCAETNHAPASTWARGVVLKACDEVGEETPF